MCTLVAVWMWVPRHQDLTMMATNACLSVALLRSHTALFVLTNHRSPLSPGPPPRADRAVGRISPFPFFSSAFPGFSFLSSLFPPPVAGQDSERVNGSVASTVHCLFCVSSPFFTIAFSFFFFFFLREEQYDATRSCLLVLGLCFIVLIFQIKLLSVIHTDP